MGEAFIIDAVRTPRGRGKAGKGALSGIHPQELLAQTLNRLADKAGLDRNDVEDVVVGVVSQAGEQGSNVARNAVLASKLPESVPGVSVDRQCGSSQQALHFAAQAVMSGTMDCVIAAGVESMTRVPMGTSAALPRKNGMGFYMSPEMQRRYPGVEFSQFMGAEMLAKKYDLSRETLDRFALLSHQRAIAARRIVRVRCC